jgi:hypothetical protein
MKLSRFFFPALVLGALVCITSATAFAQPGIAPNQQLGVGIHTEGFAVAYAISPAFQIGTDFGLVSVTGTGGSTTIDFGPYARFLFEGVVNPFVQVGFGLTKPGTGDAVTSLYAAGGLEYFLNQNVGIHGEFNLISIPFQSGANSIIGFRAGRVGMEWWFNR